MEMQEACEITQDVDKWSVCLGHGARAPRGSSMFREISTTFSVVSEFFSFSLFHGTRYQFLFTRGRHLSAFLEWDR